jgi:hypothetical protein
MRIRDTWVLEDHDFDEPSDWAIATELKPTTIDEADDDRGFRSLLEDPEACRRAGDERGGPAR